MKKRSKKDALGTVLTHSSIRKIYLAFDSTSPLAPPLVQKTKKRALPLAEANVDENNTF